MTRLTMPHGFGVTFRDALERNRVCYAAGWYGLPIPMELQGGVNGTVRGMAEQVPACDRASYRLGERHRVEFPDTPPYYYDATLTRINAEVIR